MHSQNGSISLIYNGEIYNYRELRAELAGKSEFRTNSDTEVILNGYLVWGEKVFSKLNGIFAVAIWHRFSHELLLARDPVGVKPLYILETPESFYFSSELKSFTTTGLARKAAGAAVAQFLSAAYVFNPHAALRGVRQIEPGHLMMIGPDLRQRVREFRGLPGYGAQPAASIDAWQHFAREQICRAVVRQTVSDVSYGLLLSSGVDSMTILAALHQHGLAERLQTYTVTYENQSFAEHEAVERLARQWGFYNECITLTDRMVKERLSDLFYSFDNLELLPTCAAIHEVSRIAGRSNRVLLSGNGGDELFLGYPTYRATNIVSCLPLLGGVASRVRFLSRLAPVTDNYLTPAERIRRFIVGARTDPLASHMNWRHVFTPDELSGVLASPSSAVLDNVFKPQMRYFEEADKKGYHGLAKYSYGDLRTWMLDHSLMMWDKAGMSASTEIRVPLLDLDLLDFVLAIPIDVRGNKPGSKSFMRGLFKDVLPRYITGLPKKGFQAPVASWLRGALGLPFRELTDTLPATFINKAAVARLWRDFEQHRRDNALKLWVLGALAGWAAVHKVDLAD
jgi:asparagine synthase (glutamine-hydrolysing)